MVFNRSLRRAAAITSGLLASAAPAGVPAKVKVTQPDTRPMLRQLDAAELMKKGFPLHCIFMRGDGSQFAVPMTLRLSAAKAEGASEKASLQIEGSGSDLPSGTFDGAVAGLPLMDQEFFDLGKSDDNGGLLKLTFAFQANLQIKAVSYRATLLNQHEDLAYAAAVGFCYMRESVIPILREAK